MIKTFKALGRMKAGKMNQTESKYALRLEGKRRAGEIQEYWFDAINLRLGDNCHYRPDFLVLLSDGTVECHEIKGGFITDDAVVKIKVAAEKFPFVFRMFIYKGKAWTQKDF